ncbi:MAG: aspartate 1-decarboxylase [Chlamydiae bacterium]|nr:aspartate 1-decarboxylase [Chlamydiota bacterium]MBI3265789.1 aspartate 1-decarboxylase [Chlamydiota bacterium]
MLICILKSKIHGATVTESNLHYQGSITIDENLLEASRILPFEKVQVVNLNNGARMETYAMRGPRGSGIIGMNGGMARWGLVGDKVLIISYGQIEEAKAKMHRPKVVFVNEKNRIKGKVKRIG